MSLSALPLDVLFDVAANLHDLRDLRALVTSNRSLYQTFQDHRAKLLRDVFRKQILKQCDHCFKKQDPIGDRKHSTTPLRVLNFVNRILKRKIIKSDELTLRTAAWSTFLSFKSPFWVFSAFGRPVVSLCEELNQTELALSHAVELWDHLRTRQTFEHLTRSNKLANEWETSQFALKLAGIYYHDFNQPQSAVRVVLDCYGMEMKQHDFKLLTRLMEYSKEGPEQDEVLSFFRRRALIELERLHLVRPDIGGLHSTFCLIVVLCNLEKLQDAVCIFNNTYHTVEELNLAANSLTGLARRLITSLMEKQHYDEALTIRRQMLSLLSHRSRSANSSQYQGWAKQYIWELYYLDRTDEALVVEEQCWSHARQRLATVKQRSYVYTGRNAAWSLCRSYEKRGEYAHAKRVRWEYECLARECMKPGSLVPWPGEDNSTPTKEACDYLGWVQPADQVSHMLVVKV